LTSVFEITSGGKNIRLLKIRNPYGLKEWSGDWSDKSAKWTPELRVQTGSENKEDGIFFISYDDYLQFFYVTSICKYGDKGRRSVINDEHSKEKYSLIKFTIPRNFDQHVLIVNNQVHRRFMDETMRGMYRYANMKMTLIKLTTDKDVDP
jgi:calpain-15